MVQHQLVTIDGDLRLLFRVPKSAIIDFLCTEVQPDELQSAYTQLTGHDDTVTPGVLAQLSHTDVIKTLAVAMQDPYGPARNLYDEHRYRGMKSLYLYESPHLAPDYLPDIAEINRVLEDPETREHLAHWSSSVRQLTVRDAEAVLQDGMQFVEVSYSYVAPVSVVDPQSEYPTTVNDLRTGFLWLNAADGWTAICARDEGVKYVLADALQIAIGGTFSRVPIPKSVIQELESAEDLRRATTLDPRTGTRRRWTNERLVDDRQAMEEFLERDQHDERPSSGYTITLDDNTTFALGYSNERGKIFFSRDLTVSQMRQWGPDKIRTLVEAVRGLCINTPVDVIEAVADGVLTRVPRPIKDILVELASAVVACKQHNARESTLSFTTLQAYEVLGSSWVRKTYLVDCDACDEPSEVECAACGGHQYDIRDGALHCSECGQAVEPNHVRCGHGHDVVVNEISDCILLLPVDRCLRQLAALVRAATAFQFNDRAEFFYLKGNRLHYDSTQAMPVLTVDDIPELSTLLRPTVPEADFAAIRNELQNFKERCGAMSLENCSECVRNRVDAKCYLRLFGLLDADYTPRPHHGQEYGDYSRRVTVAGQMRQMVILMKSVDRLRKQPLTMREKPLGQDIASQFIEYRQHPTVEVIGIFVPRVIEDGFRASLKLDVQRIGKQVLFLEEPEVIRIIYSVMANHQLSLDQL